MKNKISALVTIYNPSPEIIDNVMTYSSQVTRVFICDNSSINHSNLFDAIPNVIYLKNPNNQGIAKAFNNVLSEDYQWDDEEYIILFDQDSKIQDGYISKLISSFDNIQAKDHNIACVGPAYLNRSTGSIEVARNKEKFAEGVYRVSEIITSSMLTKYKIIRSIHFFNDRIFLDYSDWDLCWRLRDKGYSIYVDTNLLLNHEVGQRNVKVGVLSLRVWNPIRDYYKVRDGLYLLQQSYLSNASKRRMFYMAYILPVLNILFLPDKKERARYIEKAKKDYKANLSGVISK